MVRNPLADRVERLEIDVEDLKTLPATVGRMGERLDGIDSRLGSVEGRLGSVEGRLGSVEGRLGAVEVQIVQLRREMRDGFLALKTELSGQIEANWQRTRALFEEVIDRIKTIGER